MLLLTRRRSLMIPVLHALVGRSRALPLDQIHLGITTDEIDEDLLVAIRLLQSFSLRYAELRSVWGAYNTSQPVEKIREARRLLDEHGIRTSVLGTAFFKIPLPPENAEGGKVLEDQWRLLDAAIERASILGTDKLRIFAFTHKSGAAPDKAAYPRIWELLREAVRRAKPRKVRLAVENVAGSYVSTAAQSASMLKAIPDETLGLTWDPNNAAMAGERPFPEGYGLLDPGRIIHVHLRDYRHNPDGKVVWCAVGDGEFDNLGQIRALLKAGYKQAFTLETHYRVPQGKEFASRTSMTGLLKVIAKV